MWWFRRFWHMIYRTIKRRFIIIMKKYFILSLSLLLFFVFSVISFASDTVILLTNADGKVVNPILAIDQDGIWRTDILFDAMIRLHPETLEPIPHLAKKWDICDEGLVYTFYLNEKSRWHDGIPVTASDVAFTIQSILHPKYLGPFQSDFAILEGAASFLSGESTELEGLTIIDDHTLQMTLAEPFAPFLAVIMRNLKPIPKHLLEGKEINPEMDYSNAPIGNGPYMFKRWDKGEEFVMIANADYWDGPPKIRKIIHRIIPDMASVAMAMEAGNADATIVAPPGEVPRLSQLPHLEAHILPSPRIEGVQFNLDHPILSHSLVRQAIAHAVQVEPFVEQMLQGITTPATNHISEFSWAYFEEARVPEYNPQRARELLAEAGYEDGFSITMKTNAGNVYREQFVTYMQSQLAQVGIDMKIEFLEWGTFIGMVIDGNFEMAFQANFAGIPDPEVLSDCYHSTGGTNYFNYQNPEVDALLEQGRLVADLEERKKLYYQVQEFLIQDMPMLPAFWRPAVCVINERIQGFSPSAIPPVPSYWNIYEWEIVTD